MTPEKPNNSDQEFQIKLQQQQDEGTAKVEAMVNDKFKWAIQNSNDFGEMAANRLRGLFAVKAEELKTAILMLRDSQVGELKKTQEKFLLDRQKLVLNSIRERFELFLELSIPRMADQTKQKDPKGMTDKVISTNEELERFLEQNMHMIESIDAAALLYGQVPEEMQIYLEAKMEREFGPDLFAILEKTQKGEELDEKDWELMLSEMAKLGSNPNTLQQSSVMLVLGNLAEKDRMELLRRMAAVPDFLNFKETVISMTAVGYVKSVQVNAVLDEKVQKLEAELPEAKRGDKKSLEAKIIELKTLRGEVNGERMKATQIKVIEVRRKTADFIGRRQYGHKNRAGELLTLSGAVKAGVALVGYTTIVANVGMNLLEPWEIPSNPAIWIGVTEVVAGRPEWTKRKIASALKDKGEEIDDRVAENAKALSDELNSNDLEAIFYANYADRIMQVYNQKKRENMDPHVKVTLAEIGVNSVEDLPEALKPLWGDKVALENKISTWAFRFSSKNTERGMAMTQASTQVNFIEKIRRALGAELPRFKLPTDFNFPLTK